MFLMSAVSSFGFVCSPTDGTRNCRRNLRESCGVFFQGRAVGSFPGRVARRLSYAASFK